MDISTLLIGGIPLVLVIFGLVTSGFYKFIDSRVPAIPAEPK